eukprot:TRINITY_DN16847_c0_g1_i1.p1 TRINITY_DN16847_c0_g1~~TRINITY_DN16847_c0_g1_i1.p1  ORF type:complete len:325 (+),score=60.30 TRINITY_DN16847_c0_g1_i1:306-1280(+)
MVTVYIQWPLDGSSHAIDVMGKDTVADMQKKVARVLGVPASDFVMYYDGGAMDDRHAVVADVGLEEGCTVEARPLKGAAARRELEELGVHRVDGHFLYFNVVLHNDVAATDEEKARIAQLMIDCNPTISLGRAFMTAVEDGYPITTTVLASVCDIHARRWSKGETPVHIAAERGRSEVLAALLTLGASPNTQEHSGATPLTTAALKGYVGIVAQLLDHGADVNATGMGSTPLHYAAFGGHGENVKLLLSHGAGVEIRDNSGRTALHSAAFGTTFNVNTLSSMQMLLDSGASANAVDNNGAKPIDLVGGSKYCVEAKALLESYMS